MKYKVGEYVRVKEQPEGACACGNSFVGPMRAFVGKKLLVEQAGTGVGRSYYRLSGNSWHWCDDMLEKQYRIGEKVRIKDFKSKRCELCNLSFMEKMKQYAGKVYRIEDYSNMNNYVLEHNNWYWCDHMVEGGEKSNMNTTYKCGDKVRVKKDDLYNLGCSSTKQKIDDGCVEYLILTEQEDDESCYWKAKVFNTDDKCIHETCCWIADAHFELYDSVNEIMQKVILTPAQKRGYNADQKVLVESGHYNTDLSLKSKDHFIEFLVGKFEGDYAAAVKAEMDEADAELESAAKAKPKK